MNKKNQKNENKNKKTVRWGVLVFIALFALLSVAFIKQIDHLNDITAEKNQYLEQKKVAIAEGKALEKKKNLLDSNAYIESVARKELGLVKEGETLVVPTDEAGNPINENIKRPQTENQEKSQATNQKKEATE